MQFTMNSENNLVLEYEILREDITKDWANCESKFSGRVEIVKDEKQEKLHLEMSSHHLKPKQLIEKLLRM